MANLAINGLVVDVPDRFQAGHVLTEMEAGVLNQTYRENLRNNFAERVKRAKADDGTFPAGAEETLRQEFAKYRDEYQFGERRSGHGPVDPIEREAIRIAETTIRAAIKKAGKSLKAHQEQIPALIEKLLADETKGAAIRKEAARRVKANSGVDLGELGL